MNDHFGIGAFFLVLIIIVQSIIGSYFSNKNFRYFHQTGVAIILGIIFSAIAYYGLDYSVKLEKKVFIFIFLPAIVFSEGFSLKKKIFFNNMIYILIYGFLGTIITFTLLVVCIDLLCQKDMIKIELGSKHYPNDPIKGTYLDLNTKEIILFSSALSSKDSFLASTMIDHHAFPTLFHVIFGEGIMNDATSLVLFESFELLIEQESDFQWGTIPKVLVIMLISVVLSIVSGVIFGIICTLILKHCQFISKTVVHEILIIFMSSYSSYCIIEYFNLSGIIALMVSGFIVGYYAFNNLSDKGKICANITFQTISSGAENFLFAFVGFTTFSFYTNAWSFSLIGWVLIILVGSRIISVFLVSAISRLFYKKNTFLIGLREQCTLVFTGVSRGILGFILMEQIHSEEYQDLLNSTMIGVLIITTLLFGFINPKLIDWILPSVLHHDENTASHNDIENKRKIQDYKLGEVDKIKDAVEEDKNQQLEIRKANTINNIQVQQNNSEEQQICMVQTHQPIKSNHESFNQEEDTETDYYIKKKIKIEALMNNTYDENLFKSKLHFQISRINEKYIKPFLIRNYKNNIDELIIANRYLREDKIQLMRPLGENKNSIFIKNSIKRMKTGLIMAQSQRISHQNAKLSPQINIKKTDN